MNVSDVPFRALLGRPIVVRYDASRLFEVERMMSWPEGADAILGYVYYDPDVGINVDVLAPAAFEDGTVYDDAAPYDRGARIVLRPGTYDECEVGILTDEMEEDVKRRYSYQVEIDDGYWATSPSVVSLLSLEEIDHLRHPQFPLDVEVRLLTPEGHYELVWMRLCGLSGDRIIGRLLNQPFSNMQARFGTIMGLGAAGDAQGVLRLYSEDAMIVNVPS